MVASCSDAALTLGLPPPLPVGCCFLQVINDIRNRTGARVNLFDEEKNCGDRLLQILSTEDVQDQHCAGFDAAMDCVQVGGWCCGGVPTSRCCQHSTAAHAGTRDEDARALSKQQSLTPLPRVLFGWAGPLCAGAAA